MIPRKTTHADLEHKRSIFFEVGFIISLAIVLFLMELNFKTPPVKQNPLSEEINLEQEMIPITRQEEILPPPPKLLQAVDVIYIVDDDVEIEEELEMFDSETNQDQEVEFVEIAFVELEEENEEDPIFIVVEEMPIFRPDICNTSTQGNAELMKYVGRTIQYPAVAAENSIQGKVYITFVVSPHGLVTNVQISRGVHPSLDKEAIRVVNSLPAFSPGKQRGKPVRVQYSIPISFVLQ